MAETGDLYTVTKHLCNMPKHFGVLNSHIIALKQLPSYLGQVLLTLHVCNNTQVWEQHVSKAKLN